MRGIGLLSLLLFCQFAVGQQSPNPFDIKSATSKPNTDQYRGMDSQPSSEAPIGSHTVVTYNPFDIRTSHSARSIQDTAEDEIIPSAESSDMSTTIAEVAPVVPNRLLLAGLLLLSLILTTIGITIDGSRYQHMLQTILSNSQLKALVRSGRQITHLQNILMYLSFWISASVFVFLYLNGQIHGLKWWMIPLSLLLLYLGRHIALGVLSSIFPLGITAAVHNVGIGINNMLLSIPLIISTVGLLFGTKSMHSAFLYIGIVSVVLMYTMRQIRGMGSALEMRGFNPVYFFVYLCAFEITPILVVLRLLR